MMGRYTEHQVNVHDGLDGSLCSKDRGLRSASDARRRDAIGGSGPVPAHGLRTVGQSLRSRPASWGKLARLDTVAEAWGKLIGVRPEPYVPIEHEEDDDLETDDFGDTA